MKSFISYISNHVATWILIISIAASTFDLGHTFTTTSVTAAPSFLSRPSSLSSTVTDTVVDEEEETDALSPTSLVSSTSSRMARTLDTLRQNLSLIQVGRASPSMLHHIHIKAYGLPTPISHLATISSVGTQVLTVEPYDPSILRSIEKAIVNSDLELNPKSDGSVISMEIPPMNEESRIKMAKRCKSLGEDGKIAVRNIRRKGNDDLKKMEKNNTSLGQDESKRLQSELQKITDKRVKEVEDLVQQKEKDVMTV